MLNQPKEEVVEKAAMLMDGPSGGSDKPAFAEDPVFGLGSS